MDRTTFDRLRPTLVQLPGQLVDWVFDVGGVKRWLFRRGEPSEEVERDVAHRFGWMSSNGEIDVDRPESTIFDTTALVCFANASSHNSFCHQGIQD